MSPDAGAAAKGLVLVVEDDAAIRDLLRRNLQVAGYGVQGCGDGHEALEAIARLAPVAVILDIGLPGIDGVEVCRRLRSSGDWTPVLFVTARDDEVDRIVGLELGADDYVTKPFSPRELVARLGGVLRRTRGVPAPSAPRVSVGRVVIDPGERRAYADGHQVGLTTTEFDLLAHLMRNPRRVFSREQLLSQVWGYSGDVETRTVDVHIAQIRAKLGPASPIRTVRGVGYSADPTEGVE